jgi:hypothetical protein
LKQKALDEQAKKLKEEAEKLAEIKAAELYKA